MKNSEFHRLVKKNGWIPQKKEGKGSHIIYCKNGIRYPVPFHGSKELGKGLEMKMKKEMGIK